MSFGDLIEHSVCRKFRQTAADGKQLAAARYDAFDAKRKESEAVAADKEDIEVLEKMAKDIESLKKGTENERS